MPNNPWWPLKPAMNLCPLAILLWVRALRGDVRLLGLLLLCVGCASDDVAKLATKTSALDCEPPMLVAPPYIGDTATDLAHDSELFLGNVVTWNAAAERDWIHDGFCTNQPFDRWEAGRRAVAYAQMYDLFAPVDACHAAHYLELLRVHADELLKWRDDKRAATAAADPTCLPYTTRVDDFRDQVMAAWGAPVQSGDTTSSPVYWGAEELFAGLFTYPMAAYARRVAMNPAAFDEDQRNDAIRFTTAVIETYRSFKSDLVETSTAAYYIRPAKMGTLLTCTERQCVGYKLNAGYPLSWNEGASLMKSLAEVALAADSALYRSSPESAAIISDATIEVPRVIAKHVGWVMGHFNAKYLRYWSGDQAPYYVWEHEFHNPYGESTVDDVAHGQFMLGSLAVIHENKLPLDSLLLRAARPERIQLSPQIFQRFTTTFLRLLWTPNNMVGLLVDGSVDGTPAKNWNNECAGFVALAPFDPWVWVRCRDSVHAANAYRDETYSALLRYRGVVPDWTTPTFVLQEQPYSGLDFGLPSTWQPITGDFDGDGRTDYARVGATGAWVNIAQFGGFTGGFQAYSGLDFGQPSQWQTITGDFNGDRKTDYARLGGTGAWIFTAQAGGSFSQGFQVYSGLDFGVPSTWEPITGDFDGDGRTDYARVGATGAWVFLSKSTGWFTGFQVYSGLNFGQPSQWQTITGDFNRDGRTDYARLGATGAWVFLAQSGGSFAQTFQVYSGLNFGLPSTWDTITGDFDGDARMDYARVGATGAYFFFLKSTGWVQSFHSYAELNFGQPSAWRTIAGDFNGDLRTDYARLGGTGAWIYARQSNGTFARTFQTYSGVDFGLPSDWQTITGAFDGGRKVGYARLGATNAFVYRPKQIGP
jgi:hypothetical protein